MEAGNTPTCVGKTIRFTGCIQRGKKHPHVRGEDPRPTVTGPISVETPPRAWGRRRIIVNDTPYTGNTPTCVGKTLLITPDTGSLQKHPHVRGEDLVLKRE